jgi:hypothetical protein
MRVLIIYLAMTILSPCAFAQTYTLVANCSGWQIEGGKQGQIRILDSREGDNTAVIVFDQLSGRVYSETQYIVKADRPRVDVLKLSKAATATAFGQPIDLELQNGKNLPTILTKDGKAIPLVCSYGYDNL